jgi:hypothetical protein
MKCLKPDCSDALRRNRLQRWPTAITRTLSPVRFAGETCRIAAFSYNFQLRLHAPPRSLGSREIRLDWLTLAGNSREIYVPHPGIFFVLMSIQDLYGKSKEVANRDLSGRGSGIIWENRELRRSGESRRQDRGGVTGVMARLQGVVGSSQLLPPMGCGEVALHHVEDRWNGNPSCFRCSTQLRDRRRVSFSKVRSEGWRPSRMASTMSGARKAQSRTRPTYRSSRSSF